MAEFLSFTCPSCRTAYALPDVYRRHLEGKAVHCVACQHWWVVFPAAGDAPVKLVEGRPEKSPIDLRRYRKRDAAAPAASAPAASAPPPAAQAPSASATATTHVPVQTPMGTKPSLRVVVTGPEVDLKGVFDLADKVFWMGKSGCHLNLPLAELPARAVGIRAAGGSFVFEGANGFSVPIGPVSVLSGKIDSGASISFALQPYEVTVATSATPGSPIADLGPSPAQPVAPASPVAPVQASVPRAPVPQASVPRAPVPQAPVPQPASAAPAMDLRAQVQEIAVDVRQDQQAFGGGRDLAEELDADMTITDLSASGFQASRFGNPLDGLDVRLIRQDGPAQGQAYRVTKSPLLIGRSSGDLIIRDRRVSSKHAQLDIQGPRIYTLKDLASTNGTSVNGRPVSVAHLGSGDSVSFGGVTFEFIVEVVM